MRDEVRKHIARTIKELRLSRGLSVDELGAKVERSGKTISAWEVGKGQPDADKLLELCLLFDVPISYFYPKDETADAYSVDISDLSDEDRIEVLHFIKFKRSNNRPRRSD